MSAGPSQSDLEHARDLISSAGHLVCLTGAGISAESGIPTFRDSQSGIWSRFNFEDLASESGFSRNPKRVWQWYRSRFEAIRQADPNLGHVSLAQMEKTVPNCQVITQNVDDLHERAGSRSVWHLHGELSRCHCQACGRFGVGASSLWDRDLPPVCDCGGLLRPSVVWFGELLDSELWQRCLRAASKCDVMLVVGTSGLVSPAADLPFLAGTRDSVVVDVNPHPTEISCQADLWLEGPASEILPHLVPKRMLSHS